MFLATLDFAAGTRVVPHMRSRNLVYLPAFAQLGFAKSVAEICSRLPPLELSGWTSFLIALDSFESKFG
jgi:hypothetical protein